MNCNKDCIDDNEVYLLQFVRDLSFSQGKVACFRIPIQIRLTSRVELKRDLDLDLGFFSTLNYVNTLGGKPFLKSN